MDSCWWQDHTLTFDGVDTSAQSIFQQSCILQQIHVDVSAALSQAYSLSIHSNRKDSDGVDLTIYDANDDTDLSGMTSGQTRSSQDWAVTRGSDYIRLTQDSAEFGTVTVKCKVINVT